MSQIFSLPFYFYFLASLFSFSTLNSFALIVIWALFPFPDLLDGREARVELEKNILVFSKSRPLTIEFPFNAFSNEMNNFDAFTGYLPDIIPFLCGISPLNGIALFNFITSFNSFIA